MGFNNGIGSGTLIRVPLPSSSTRNKWIALFFLPHRRLRTVPGKQAGFVGQCIDLGSNAIFQLSPASAWQVGAADGAREDNVAAEADVV